MAELLNVRTSVLDIAYEDGGPADAPVVVLLHGYPFDVRAFDDVVPIVNAQVPGPSFRISAVTVQRVSCHPIRCDPENRLRLAWTCSSCSTRCKLGRRYWLALIGVAEQPAWYQRFGRSVLAAW